MKSPASSVSCLSSNEVLLNAVTANNSDHNNAPEGARDFTNKRMWDNHVPPVVKITKKRINSLINEQQ